MNLRIQRGNTVFNIGDEFPLALNKEGVRVCIRGNEVNMWIAYSSPSPQELDLFQNSPIEIGVLGSNCGILVFGYKIGNMKWQDLYYSINYAKFLADKDNDVYIEPTIETMGEDEPLNLILYFLNTDTCRIMGKRSFKLPKELKEQISFGLHIQKGEQDLLFNNLSRSSKVEVFLMLQDFAYSQPIEAVVEPLVKHKFY